VRSNLAGIDTSVHPPLDSWDGLIDWEALQGWIADADVPGSGAVVAAELLAGGTQNNLVLMTRADGTRMVLRRPPRHPRPTSDETMRRESRVLAALRGTDVPHPAFYDGCGDPSVLGVCFYVMEPIDGFNPGTGLVEPYLSDDSWQRSLGLSMVDAIASLARVDHEAVGLTDFGKADGWIERQVGRWRSQLDGYASFEGWDGGGLPHVDRVGDWLEANRPTDFTPRVIHGDFHHANVLARYDRPELAAMVDWELSTIGDPRLDLGWLLAAWRDEADPPRPNVDIARGMGGLTRRDLVDRWADRTGLAVEDVDWWFALACYKLGIILEGSHARALAGRMPVEIGTMLHHQARWLLTMAGRIIGVA